MLEELFPLAYPLYRSQPIFGPSLEGFAAFLVHRGYPRRVVRRHLQAARRVEKRLQEKRCRSIADVTKEKLRGCAPSAGQARVDPESSAVVRLLHIYLTEYGLLTSRETPNPVKLMVGEYVSYLEQVRGLAPQTVREHATTALQFISYLNCQKKRVTYSRLNAQDVESFVHHAGGRLSRESLQHTIAHLRSLLRYLGAQGQVPIGLDSQIDTPRVYRGERLPRSLPWETVHAFLNSVDRSTSLGKRDYAMFQLVVNYGLRASEVADLKLDDIHWRAGYLCVARRKTFTPLMFPLTDAVANSLISYLRRGRPKSEHRQVFIRHRAPAGFLKPTAVAGAFRAWSRRSGLSIPFKGCHCLRHSYAIHLLRQGISLKTIGDLLGHRSTESTGTYLRLAVEDLREVALNLPVATDKEAQ